VQILYSANFTFHPVNRIEQLEKYYLNTALHCQQLAPARVVCRHHSPKIDLYVEETNITYETAVHGSLYLNKNGIKHQQ